FNDPSVFVESIERFFENIGTTVRGFEHITRASNIYLKPIPAEGLISFFKKRDLIIVNLVLENSQIELLWRPIFRIWGKFWDVNVQLRMWFPEPASLSDGIKTLKGMVSRLGLFWGEVQDRRVTRAFTFCGLNEHTYFVPNVSSANYFG